MTLIEKFPLEKKKITKKTIDISISTLFIGVFLLSWMTLTSIMSFLTIALASIIFLPIIIYFYQKKYYQSYFYDDLGKNLIIRKGVFSIEEITLPYSKIQDVYVDQDLFDRLFSLYDVHVSSATMASARLSHIDGVSKKSADELRELFLNKIHAK